jgi:CBS domain containing-hemolysin-like protein
MVETSEEAEPSSRRRAGLVDRLSRLFARGKSGSAGVVAAALREREANGEDIGLAHKDLILRAASFDRLKVADVMRPRAEIVAIEASATLGEAARVFSESQHSRLPIYGETLDDPQGFVHVRDVMALLAPTEEGEVNAKFTDRLLMRIRRDILFVPQSMTLATLFLKMQSSRIHLALVVDEDGGTDGLVSMEDLVEQIVGAIDDEHEDEFDTAAGLAVALAGRLPQRGEILRHPAGFDVEIIDADPRRVKRVRIKPANQLAAAQQPAAPAAERARGRGA